MPALTACEMASRLDEIRACIRRKAGLRGGVRGGGVVDRLIDMILAPLILDAASGRYSEPLSAAADVAEDLRIVLSKKSPAPPKRRLR